MSRTKENRNMRIASFVTAAALLVMGTITFAQNVSYDFDRATNFSGIRTYAWVRGTTLDDELNHSRIVRAIDAQLTLKGLVKLETPSNADVVVAYHATFDRDLQINGFASGWGGYRFAGSRAGTVRAEEILVGTLVVDVVNAKINTIVWRGIASKDIDVTASPEKRDKNITKTAEKLFKNYPPKKSS
jgi:hypothetical protein